MDFTIGSTPGDASVNLMELMAESSKSSQESRKTEKLSRQLHHDKNIAMMDESIDAMKDQANQISKGGFFNFIMGMVSNVLNIATQVISFVCPPAAPFAQIGNQALQGVINSVQAMDIYGNKAREAGIKAEEFKQDAEIANKQYAMSDEHLRALTESDQTMQNYLEKAIFENQAAASAAVRV